MVATASATRCTRCNVSKPPAAFSAARGDGSAVRRRLCSACRQKARQRYGLGRLAPERRLRLRLDRAEEQLGWAEGQLDRAKEDLARLRQCAAALEAFESRERCGICSSEEHPTFVRCSLVRCGHKFCRQCIENWHASRNRTCPTCRASFSYPAEVKEV